MRHGVKKMRVLFLTNLFPYPLDNGGKIKTYSTLKALNEMGCEIDLMCFSENIESDRKNLFEIEKICNHVDLIEHKLTTKENLKKMLFVAAKSIISKYPYVVYKCKNQEMYRKIQEKLKHTNYDFIYFSYLQMFVYFYLLNKDMKKAKIIIDQQNCESQIMERTLYNTNNIFKKIFLKLEYHKLARFEKKSLSFADKVFVLSQQDLTQMKKLGASFQDVSILPIAVMDKGIIEKDGIKNNRLTLLFVGTLTWNPNDDGIRWFVKHVVPLLEQRGIPFQLYIVGKNPSLELKKLCERNSNSILTGYVEDIDEYYQKADVMVVPLFIGGGQRVKIIEAFSRGLPVISTSIGAEGLGYTDGENILIADDEKEYVKAIEQIFNMELYEKLKTNERKLYEEKFSLLSYCNNFIKEISKIDKV